jgi:hypothetical protein
MTTNVTAGSCETEKLLRDPLQTHVGALPDDAIFMLKPTIPTQPGLYAGLAADPRVLRVLALSGGYSRDEACDLLARDPSMIASFSRCLSRVWDDPGCGPGERDAVAGWVAGLGAGGCWPVRSCSGGWVGLAALG